MGMRDIKRIYLIPVILILLSLLYPQMVGGDGGFMVNSKYIKGDISDDPASPVGTDTCHSDFTIFSGEI